MHAEDIRTYLQSTYKDSIVHQDDNISSFQINSEEIPSKNEMVYRITYIDQLGKLNLNQYHDFRNLIYELIMQDLSNAVFGAYTYNNFIERPKSSCILISSIRGTKLSLELLFYFRPDQMNICTRANMSTQLRKILKEILNIREKVIFLVSGRESVSYIKNSVSHTNFMESMVYILDRSKFSGFQVPELNRNFSYLEFSDRNFPKNLTDLNDDMEEKLQLMGDFYGYKMTISELHGLILQKPQFLILDLSTKKFVAGSRANSCQQEFAVIGGVHTLPSYRNLHLGTILCYRLCQLLLEKSRLVVLDTDLQNIPARRIYQALGFQESGVSAYFDRKTEIVQELIGDRDY